MRNLRGLPLGLAVAGALAFWPGFLAVAPNRLSLGAPVALLACAPLWGVVVAAALAALAAGAVWARAGLALVAGAALIWVAPLAAGAGARTLSAHAPHAARIELATGFWLLLAVGVLAVLDAGLALPARPWRRVGVAVVLVGGRGGGGGGGGGGGVGGGSIRFRWRRNSPRTGRRS
jgi:hypothetical protein